MEFSCVGINHVDFRPNTYQNGIWRYFIFYFDSNMMNIELKGLHWLLRLVRVVAGLLPLNQYSQKHGPNKIGPCRPCQKVVPLYIGLLTPVFLFFVYTYKTRIMLEYKLDSIARTDILILPYYCYIIYSIISFVSTNIIIST